MTYEMYRYVYLIAIILGAITLALAIFLFFKFDIPKVIGDITGSTARKAIQELREQNANSGNKAYKPSPVNLSRGKLTDKISASGQLTTPSQNHHLGTSVGTSKISTQDLSQDNTIVLNEGYNSNETSVLSDQTQETASPNISVEVDLTFVHTNEVID